MLNIQTTKNIINTTTTYYLDEMGNPLCAHCVAEQYPHNHGLQWEITDPNEPIDCDGCGEPIIASDEEDDDSDEWGD